MKRFGHAWLLEAKLLPRNIALVDTSADSRLFAVTPGSNDR
jgi:hypothetical protein